MIRLTLVVVGLILLVVWGYQSWLRMPGSSFKGELPPLTPELREGAESLREDVEKLASDIGARNYWFPRALTQASDYISNRLAAVGYPVAPHRFQASGKEFVNLEATRHGVGRPEEILVVGAHYDTVMESPGADDNASGVAALLALAERFAEKSPARTIRFVAFANEEPPFFQTGEMGSYQYAQRCRREGEQIVGMISLEMLGFYSSAKNSQAYPFPLSAFYPDTGDFIAFVANLRSKSLVRETIAAFRAMASFPSEGAALPASVPGVAFSDHWSFWQHGYPALMVTDTAFFRYDHYHSSEDTPDKLDFERMARVVEGLTHAIDVLANRPSASG